MGFGVFYFDEFVEFVYLEGGATAGGIAVGNLSELLKPTLTHFYLLLFLINKIQSNILIAESGSK